MCGIVGIYGGDIRLIDSACSSLSHRGPDDSGIYLDHKNKIALGHQRLSIIDLSDLGHQPMFSEDKKIVIVFNGEIYNFIELKDDLIKEGYSFKGSSDTEVLLNLYIAYGEEMLEKLNGIFAFAILDISIKKLFIARDALGVKPLYYSQEGETFAFASEIKSLFDLEPKDIEIDIESLNRYLAFLWCPGDGTPIKSIKKLKPGEALIIKNGQIKKKWFWYKLPFFRNINSDLSKAESINGTTYNLRKAVHRQMVSDAPLGAFLSGGLDSSAVVSFARELNQDINCFTIETIGKQERGFIDDLPFAKKVAKHLNVNLEVVPVDSSKIADDIQSMVVQLDEPIADPASLNVRYISKLAREQGIKVLLSGAGGDDLFTGYRRHHAIEIERYWSWMPQNIRTLLDTNSKGLDTTKPFQRRLKKLLSGASLNENDRLINYFRWTNDATLEALFSDDFKEIIQKTNPNTPLLEFISPISRDSTKLDRMLSIEQRFFLADHNLNYTDKMSMAEGVETRVPFLDTELVDFVAKIPSKFKQNGRQGKWVLKKAMEPFLPKSIIYRPKTGFGVPLRRWINKELNELLRDLLSSASIKNRGIFSAQSVQKLLMDNHSGKIDASYTILSLLCIEIWCRAYIDK
jgi:asparagine synthase (glutamine-hydrolysing)